MRELIAGQEQAQRILEPLYGVSRISTGIDPSINSVVIETANDLTVDQLEIVRAAVLAAGVPVRVETVLGPGPDPSLPPVSVVWTLVSAGDDLRSLLVSYLAGPNAAGEATISVRETDDEIWIAIEMPDIRSLPGTGTPAIAIAGRETVHLKSRVGGRRVTGPEGSPSWHASRYGGVFVDDGSWRQFVPRVVGLHPDDAGRLLLSQELLVELKPAGGREIVAQDPPADTPVEPGTTVMLTGG